jgi:hypothetical protein
VDFGIHIGTRGCLTSREATMAVAPQAEALGYAYPGIGDRLIVPTRTDVRYVCTADGDWPGAPTAVVVVPLPVLRFGPPVWIARQGPDGQQLFSGESSDMVAHGAALAMVGARHVILYLQRPTIEETLEVLQRFEEEVVCKT